MNIKTAKKIALNKISEYKENGYKINKISFRNSDGKKIKIAQTEIDKINNFDYGYPLDNDGESQGRQTMSVFTTKPFDCSGKFKNVKNLKVFCVEEYADIRGEIKTSRTYSIRTPDGEIPIQTGITDEKHVQKMIDMYDSAYDDKEKNT